MEMLYTLENPDTKENNSTTNSVEVIMPLYNFNIIEYSKLSEKFKEDINFKDFFIKAIPEMELIGIQEEHAFLPSFTDDSTYAGAPEFLVKKEFVPKDGIPRNAIIEKEFCDFLTALRVFKKGSVSTNQISYLLPESDSLSVIFQKGTKEFGEYMLEYKDLVQVEHFFDKISCNNDDSIDLSLRWFNKIYSEPDFEDMLIDLIIAFEALTCADKGSNSGNTIAVSISMLIGNDAYERRKVRDRLLEAYSIRNKIVHASGIVKKFSDLEIIQDSIEYYRLAICHLLKVEHG